MGMIDAIKDAATLVQKADNIDLYRVLLQVQQEALNLVQEKSLLVEENIRLREQVRDLQAKAGARASLVRRDGMYFAEGDRDPFCPHCWETEQMQVHLARYQNQPGYFCRKCGKGIH